ncbi:MAG TPA: SDR family oxidoreductase [Chitinophagaceae bacterium]|jgi:NAD(P)-dependent dehydrogenase (short-subunit alcohol dehydrogenase family)|nr:SDR family oxidoreductase [Chitinophagaceae bacterium]
MDWKDKIVVITGASTGIGKATREFLECKGATVYNLDIHDTSDPQFIKCDVRIKDAIKNALAKVHGVEKRIDMLFANAGIHLFATMEETSDEEFENLLAINIRGTFYTVKYVLPYMKAQGKGSILLMGSDQSSVGKASSSVYGMTKGAIVQLTKSTAIDYAKFGIGVNCIGPGTINTPLLHKAVDHFSRITGTDKREVYKSLDGVQPLGRIGLPEEIAATAAFLLSDESSFTTGALFPVDGGYIAQ